MVHDVDVAGATGQPQRLGGEAAGTPGASVDERRRPHQVDPFGQIGVGGGETRRRGDPELDVRRHLGQPEQLTHEVLLRAADASRPAPQQVHQHPHGAITASYKRSHVDDASYCAATRARARSPR